MVSMYPSISEILEAEQESRRSFFTLLWGTEPATVTISLRKQDDPTFHHDERFLWPKDFKRLNRYVDDRASSYDVFMTPARFNVGSTNRREESVSDVKTLWVDLDQEDNEESRGVIEDLGGFVVESGTPGHYHGYLPLKEAIPGPQAKALNNRLKVKLKGDHKESQSGILRVIHTTNYKETPTEESPRSVTPVTDLSQVRGTRVSSIENLLGVGAEVYKQLEDFDLTPIVLNVIPTAVEEILTQDFPKGKRSEAIASLVATAINADLKPGEIADVLLNWDVAREKHRTDNRILADLNRMLKRFNYIIDDTDFRDDWDLTYLDQTDDRPPSPFIIQNMVPEGGMVILTGASGTGKSFIAVDAGLSVAHGTPWAGHKVKRGKVMYVAMEGQDGLVQRSRAWHKVYDREYTRDFAVLEFNFSMSDDKSFHRFTETVAGFQPSLIIIDTVAHAMVGLEENSASEMSQFIKRVSMVRTICDSTVMLIHHASKAGDAQHNSRGSGALPAAADAGFTTEKGRKKGTIRLKCTKQKDIEQPQDHIFELESVTTDRLDWWGDPVPDPAVAKFTGTSASLDEEEKEEERQKREEQREMEKAGEAIIRVRTAAEEIYNYMFAMDEEGKTVTDALQNGLGARGRNYAEYREVFEDMEEWGIIQETEDTRDKVRGKKYVLNPIHGHRYRAWKEGSILLVPGSDDSDEENTDIVDDNDE